MAELDTKGRLTRTEVADFLREFASELDDRAVSERLRNDPRAVGDDDHERTEVRDTERREGRSERYEETDTGNSRSPELADDTEDTSDQDTVDAKRVTLVIGGDSATVTVPEMVEFDVEVSSRSPMFSSGVNQEITFDLSWEIENLEERERSIDVV